MNYVRSLCTNSLLQCPQQNKSFFSRIPANLRVRLKIAAYGRPVRMIINKTSEIIGKMDAGGSGRFPTRHAG